MKTFNKFKCKEKFSSDLYLDFKLELFCLLEVEPEVLLSLYGSHQSLEVQLVH